MEFCRVHSFANVWISVLLPLSYNEIRSTTNEQQFIDVQKRNSFILRRYSFSISLPPTFEIETDNQANQSECIFSENWLNLLYNWMEFIKWKTEILEFNISTILWLRVYFNWNCSFDGNDICDASIWKKKTITQFWWNDSQYKNKIHSQWQPFKILNQYLFAPYFFHSNIPLSVRFLCEKKNSYRSRDVCAE